MAKANCPFCKRETDVFTQDITIPLQPTVERPEQHRYLETYCAYCGTLVSKVEKPV